MPTQDLISRAARFFVPAEQSSRIRVTVETFFWELSAPLVVDTMPHLPAMAAAVRIDNPNDFQMGNLWEIAYHHLPGVLSPEAVPWHNHLVAAWEVHRRSGDARLQNLARQALVRLDGCGMPDGHERPSRLREWLAQAQTIVGRSLPPVRTDKRGRRTYSKLQALAALAAWRPAPRVVTPPETLREWGNFWLRVRESEDPVEKGLAVIALLNLPEADLRSASIPSVPTAQLLHELTTAIQVATERRDKDNNNYLSLLNWQPVKETTWPAAEVEKIAQTWLEVTKHKNWRHRCTAWRQLIRWDRAGNLATCGMDLLPELVKAVQTEEEGLVLWAMARWVPTAERFTSTGTPDRRTQLQQLERAWKWHRVSGYFWESAPAWLAGIRLHQAGLAAETPESFLGAYLPTVADSYNKDLLFILAQWSPGAEVPERWHREWSAAWQQRLMDESQFIRQTATWALLRQSLKKAPVRSLRCTALELWRTGTKASSDVKDTLSAASVRFQEVRGHLAAGEVPDFETKPTRPTERCRPPLALPPGRIAGGEWQMENEKLKMENGEWGVKHQKARLRNEQV